MKNESLLAERYALGLDLWSGRPLEGTDLEEWRSYQKAPADLPVIACGIVSSLKRFRDHRHSLIRVDGVDYLSTNSFRVTVGVRVSVHAYGRNKYGYPLVRITKEQR